jgi:chemotaxis protein methyltransferase CheR
LGNLARGDNRIATARRHFKNAQRLLRVSPADEPLPESDGMTAGRLLETISALLSVLERPPALLDGPSNESREP